MFHFRRSTVFNLVRLFLIAVYGHLLSSTINQVGYMLLSSTSLVDDRIAALLVLGLVFGTMMIGLTSISIMEYEKGKEKNHEQ